MYRGTLLGAGGVAGPAATPVTNNTNFVDEGTFSTTDRQGYRMAFNNTTNITKVTVLSSVSPTKAWILDHATHATIGSATFSGQVATFAGAGVAVSAANDYDVIVDAEGASWGSSYKNTYNLPANNTDINFTAVVYFNGSWSSVTSGSPVGGIVSVTTQA